jgi:hypothetical protein
MKRRENSEKILFYKKLNKYNKTNHFRKRLDDTNPSLWPLIINRKNKYDNSKIDSILQSTNDKKDKYINNRNTLKTKNSFTLLFSMPNKNEKIIQTNIVQKSLMKNNKDRLKELLIKKVNKFLFSKRTLKSKLNLNTEKTSSFNISNHTPQNNSFNFLKQEQIQNYKYFYNNKPNLASLSKKNYKFKSNEYILNLNQLNNQIFRNYMYKQKRKFDKLLLNIKKSLSDEVRKINNDLSFTKAKNCNSKINEYAKNS